ncbi:MAG: phosphatase PAP2 family protein [Spirochaetia bacterium]|nr:phosphatase PAP2 family protein [Spirochaetia bacterium]
MIFLSAMADGLFVIMISSAVYRQKKGYYWSFMIAYLVSNIIVNIIKSTYSTGRPLAYYSIDEIYYAGEILRFQSFPSGHATAAMVLMRYLIQDAGKKITVLIIILGLLSAASRVYIGVHFPYDVIFGGYLGFFITHGVFIYAAKRYKHSDRPEYKYNNLLISICGLSAGIFYLFFNNDMYAPLSKLINIITLLFSIFFTYTILSEFFKIYQNKSTNKSI